MNKFKIDTLHLAIGLFVGAMVGIGGYAFFYAKGFSYMSDDPKACVNCHIMNDQYYTWSKSPHHHVAVCNDCHLPHNKVGKYIIKARNGLAHSWAFTTGWFKEPIHIKNSNLASVQNSCMNCHQNIVEAITAGDHFGGNFSEGKNTKFENMSCTRCHKNVGHVQ